MMTRDGVVVEQPDVVSQYRRALSACVRLQQPDAYRAFVVEWRDLIQRGAVERLVAMDDAALAVRLAWMALDDPDLADVHGQARATLERFGAVVSRPTGTRPVRGRPTTVRLRRPGGRQ